MRRSKLRKQAKKSKKRQQEKEKREKKDKEKEKLEKYLAWKNLPTNEWTEARKKRNGIIEGG